MLRKYLPKNPDINTLKAFEQYLTVLDIALSDESFIVRENFTKAEEKSLKALKNHNLSQLNMVQAIIRDLEMKAKKI